MSERVKNKQLKERFYRNKMNIMKPFVIFYSIIIKYKVTTIIIIIY